MYESYYGLREAPFNISTDPRFFWWGEQQRGVLASLGDGLLRGDGFVVLTGDVGTGKTTLLNALLQSLEGRVERAVVNNPKLADVEFFNLVAHALGSAAIVENKADFLHFLTPFLEIAQSRRRPVLLVVDEAHCLSDSLLEEIRLLSNMERRNRKLLTIFFVGQNEFEEKLQGEGARSLRQRITLSCRLEPLTKKEVASYVRHRLRVAGAVREIFTPAALVRVSRHTRGYPRLINVLCDRALLSGYGDGRASIAAEIVDECAGEMDALVSAGSGEPIGRAAKRATATRRGGASRPPDLGESAGAAAAKAAPPVPPETPSRARDRDGKKGRILLAPGGGRRKKGRRRRSRLGSAALVFATAIALVAGTMTTLSEIDLRRPQILGPQTDRGVPAREGGPAPRLEEPRQGEPGPGNDESDGKADGGADAMRKGGAGGADSRTPLREMGASRNFPEAGPFEGGSIRLTAAQPNGSGQAFGIAEFLSGRVDEKASARAWRSGEDAAAALARGEYRQAVRILEAGRREEIMKSETSRRLLARAFLGLARQQAQSAPEEAVSLLEKAAKVAPEVSEVPFQLGRIHTMRNDYDAAIAAYSQAIELDPERADAMYNLGFLFARTERFHLAEEWFGRAVEKRPPYLDKALVNLALVQERLGKEAESKQNLEQALAVQPDNRRARRHLKRLEAGKMAVVQQ